MYDTILIKDDAVAPGKLLLLWTCQFPVYWVEACSCMMRLESSERAALSCGFAPTAPP